LRRHITVILAVMGLGLFLVAFLRLDPQRVLLTIRQVTGKELAALFLMRLGFWLFHALGWKLVLEGCEGQASILQLLKARLAGHAFGYLTPTSKLGGEAFKVFMVGGTCRRTLAASAIVAKTLELQAMAFIMVVAVLSAISRISLPARQQWLFAGLALLVILLLSFFARQQQRGLFSLLLRFMDRRDWRIPLVERNRQAMTAADSYMAVFYKRGHAKRLIVLLIYGVMTFWWVAEIHVNLVFVGAHDISAGTSLLLVSLGSFSSLLPGLPGSLGIYEATYLSLFVLLAIPMRTGIALVIFRRVLSLVWAGIGLLVIGLHRKAPPAKKTESLV